MSLTVALVVLALLLSCLLVMAFEVVYSRAEMAVGAARPIASVRTGIRSPLRPLGQSTLNRGLARHFRGSLSGKGPAYTGFLLGIAGIVPLKPKSWRRDVRVPHGDPVSFNNVATSAAQNEE